MNIIQLYEDFNIAHDIEGQKNTQAGWVNITCPFCADHSNHLGYNISGNYYHCWRCGGHPTPKVIAKLAGVTEQKAREILHRYKIKISSTRKEPLVKIRAKAHRLPPGTGMMITNHRRYLKSRGFDPDQLEHTWGLLGTGPIAPLDGIDYKHRVLAPIYWDGKQVSFQARDITGKSDLKYMACPKDRELIHHKHILYGKQQEWTDTGICVEGITDVWRFGARAFCTFGIKYTPTQLQLIAKTFRRVAVVFDDDKWAEWQSRTLVSELQFRGVEAWKMDITGDPGAMSQDDANHLIKNL